MVVARKRVDRSSQRIAISTRLSIAKSPATWRGFLPPQSSLYPHLIYHSGFSVYRKYRVRYIIRPGIVKSEQIVNSNLLTTKLYIPTPRQNFIQRRRILDLLDKALNHKLTLIAAPPGYGKTTLLSIWISESVLPAAWLALDSDDNDPSLFLQYLIAALQTIDPQIGYLSLAQLKSPQLAAQNDILPALINDLTQIQGDFVLILDDYQWIDQQEIHTSLDYLLDHLPPQMHLIISSRSDPPLHLSRLRTRNQLLEIRQSDLRMTQIEASEFLNHSMRLNLSDQQVETLEVRTEGWIAGLQLAALSLREKKDIDGFLQSFGGSHRYVIDYLADEVLAEQSDEVQSFLEQTAFLDRISAPLCDAVTGRENSIEILRLLEENNLFLIPLDDQRQWYRFHHLFLDYLRTDLESSDLVAQHKNASQWFSANNFYPEAVKHALASKDMELMVETISQAAPPAVEQAAFITLNGWLDSLSDQLVRQTAGLALYKSFILFFTQTYQMAIPYVKAAQDNLPDDASNHLHGQLKCIQAHLALCQNQLDLGIEYARDALEFLDESDFFYRNLSLNVLGQILEMKGDVFSASEIYHQAFVSGYQRGERLGTMVVFTNLIISLNELGRRREGIALCESVNAEIGGESLAGRPLSDVISLSWSQLSYEADQLELARQQAQDALETLTRAGISQGLPWAQYLLARIHMTNGEWDEFKRITQEGIALAARTGTLETHGSWFTALEAQASLKQGDLHAAIQWADSKGYTPQDKPHHWVEWPYFTYIRVLLVQNRFQDAEKLLETMQTSAQEGKRLRKLITIHLLMALIDLAQDDRSTALQQLELALSIAAPQDYQRAFLDEGQVILDLLPEVHHIAPEFVDRILVGLHPEHTSSFQMLQPYEPLSERELEVLHLVARGYSNRQIAEALFITLGTVKKHLNNIFSKLQVKNRTQAVARSRELNLLD